MYSDVGCSS